MSIPSDAESTKTPIATLVNFLANEPELQFTSLDIAETLWLATQIDSQESSDSENGEDAAQDGSQDLQPPPEPADGKGEDELLRRDDLENLDTPKSPIPEIDIATPTPKVGVLPKDVLPVWLTDPSILTDGLSVMRALKPLLMRVDAKTGQRLDEQETVERIARTRMWLPVVKPEQEPWFDVLLVVDQGSSMQIWQRLVKDVVRILRRYGAFRDLLVYDLVVNRQAQLESEKVLLSSHPSRPGHRPKELIDQEGRRIVIFLSDCAGDYWWDGTLLPLLTEWATKMPAVVWQMLPEWMWERTALGRGRAVAISNDRPGAVNQRLNVRLLDRSITEQSDQSLSVPVMTGEDRDLANWSYMLAGQRREITAGFLLPVAGGAIPKSRSIEELAQDRLSGDSSEHDLQVEIETIARNRVKRFRQLSSPAARRLVMLLAAAPVITLPVMRLIRDSMMSMEKSPLPIAEVFLGGLLKRIPGQDESEQELVQYDFVPKVRDVLLDVLPQADTIDVINSVSAAVERQWNKYSEQSFRAFLTNPTIPSPPGMEELRSFASVTADILEQLGEEYSDFVQQLRYGSESEDSDPTEVSLLPFPELDDPQVSDFEYIYPVSLPSEPTPIGVEEGSFKFVGSELVPQQKTVEEVIFEIDPRRPVLKLESFPFRIAHIQRDQFDWRISYEQAEAQCYKELLESRFFREDIVLEMVPMLAGTFLMGAAQDEDGNKSEEPQHTVNVSEFFMSRYPVTQAQWRIVAQYERVNRDLVPNPSAFKGDRIPVELVSWYDAVEFCERLSQRTGRNYRLPTEAEWEYACRAGTTTPFSFGEMITTELANYSGASYRSGPEGQRRGTTIPVTELNHANAFGLSGMHGNVLEWCLDHWHQNYENAPTDGSAWLTDNDQASRILRGGSWNNGPRYCRSASRDHAYPGYSSVRIGFRIVLAPR